MSGKLVAALKVNHVPAQYTRAFSAISRRQNEVPRANGNNDAHEATKSENGAEEQGAMARRLSEMAEQAVLEGGKSARQNIEQAGFSDELKKQLEERVAATAFKNEYPAAHSILDMPESAGEGTRATALGEAWSGTENMHDSALRMLDDSARKPIRTPYKIPSPVQTNPVDMRIAPKPKLSPGHRLAHAKDQIGTYSLSQSPGVSEQERQAMRKEMQERFTPGARPMPMSIQGLASLANEQIEDAIKRGQFSSIKKGRGVNTQTDHNANSAYIDTTEYFMNKMIQKQELVPPWIEKQQELAKEVDRFRQRIRVEWRRHAARLIASKGGTLDAQMRRADAYAAAEARVAERAAIAKSFRDDNDTKTPPTTETKQEDTPQSETAFTSTEEENDNQLPHLEPLRDPNYLAIERPYHELTIKTLNDATRTYNLQAPPVSRKPYLNLERELNACYAEVAPSLAEEIKRRALEKAHGPVSSGPRAAGILESLGTAQAAQVYDEDSSKGYGVKDLLRDWFSGKKGRS
ncbi:DnaJ family domain-containing protein [Aspergillus candidus]|uniref:DnaJ homologue subfamily C member 28 conserved domain-containing protein n=1 Tax=Aspergillus candidus TaxID=41067 RepID=A0A2I2FMP7_ASPCN|nr:hypothetical protein BDW47DRAFT_98748 [Aspergillus candidus]PLB41894.1 hypothetical protein BDW47DRAFT_98748 [Aspergillus candidus]